MLSRTFSRGGIYSAASREPPSAANPSSALLMAAYCAGEASRIGARGNVAGRPCSDCAQRVHAGRLSETGRSTTSAGPLQLKSAGGGVHRMRRRAARARMFPKEEPPGGGPHSTIVGQADISAGFDLRRYAVRPMPAKPRKSIAQVEASGTPDTGGDDL